MRILPVLLLLVGCATAPLAEQTTERLCRTYISKGGEAQEQAANEIRARGWNPGKMCHPVVAEADRVKVAKDRALAAQIGLGWAIGSGGNSAFVIAP